MTAIQMPAMRKVQQRTCILIYTDRTNILIPNLLARYYSQSASSHDWPHCLNLLAAHLKA